MSSELLLVEPRGHATGVFHRLRASRLHGASGIREALARRRPYSLWIAPSEPAIDLLLGSLPRRPKGGDQRLLSLQQSPGDAHSLIHAHFRFVVSAGEGVRLLPARELAEVLESQNQADLFIGGLHIPSQSTVLLYRGNLEPISIPSDWLAARSTRTKPDVAKLEVTDCGQTVRFGVYEAATDAILYEFDEDYRVRVKRQLRATDTSIGGAVRRLRLQKGLRQSDFPGLSAKEIARIEQGKVKTPRLETLQLIAEAAGVPVSTIPTY